MFTYKVIAKGTYKGRFYSPYEVKDDRRQITVAEKFDPVPKWLEPVKNNTKPSAREQTKSTKISAPKNPGTDFAGGKQEVI